MTELCEKEICTGCGACESICPTNAISMLPDENGFQHPKIDSSLCISCKACLTHCPATSACENTNEILSVYAAYNKNRKVRKTSSSGGIVTLLSKLFLENGGLVIGVAYNESLEAEFVAVEKESTLAQIRGSKYVQAHTNKIYQKIKSALQEGREVLFVGTPCQCHALDLFLNGKCEKLLKVDLVCHGVPSDMILKRWVDEIGGGKKAKNIVFRDKRPFWDPCKVTIHWDDGSEYSKYTQEDPYFTLFNYGYSLRESCSECKYTTQKRFGDITLSDFWGFSPKNFKMRNFAKGTSCVLINNQKGLAYFEKIKSASVYEESTLKEALCANQPLSKPFNIPKDRREAFWRGFHEGVSLSLLQNTFIANPLKAPRHPRIKNLKKKWYFLIGKPYTAIKSFIRRKTK